MADVTPGAIRALHVPDVHFFCEQAGEVEAELKARWVQLLAGRSGVTSAYLARVQYGTSKETTVALCIRVIDGAAAETAVGRCAAAFVSRFGSDQALDILILTASQERALQAVCPPFFREETAAGHADVTAQRSDTLQKKSNPIVWFELQIAPFELRLAVLPGQPVLFGYAGDEGRPGPTWLLRTKENPDAARAFAASLANVLSSCPVYRSEPNEAAKCFQAETLKAPSLHLRLAWADGTRWATFYPLDALPPQMAELVSACRRLGNERIVPLHSRALTAEEALREVRRPSDPR
jgi:hypothetical protein